MKKQLIETEIEIEKAIPVDFLIRTIHAEFLRYDINDTIDAEILRESGNFLVWKVSAFNPLSFFYFGAAVGTASRMLKVDMHNG